jgi:oligopeptide/dipeptide ABC transporter ATP-binding protein
MPGAGSAVLSIRDLRTYLDTSRGQVHAVEDVSLEVYPGESVALVGESGCGKTMTALSVMRLLPSPPARTVSGTITLADGSDVLQLSQRELRKRRGSVIGMMFQDPSAYLNPVARVGDQVAESLALHDFPSDAKAVDAVLHVVGLPAHTGIARRYPHELSGGMRQRALLGVAIACRPSLLIADEPTTALDVTVQAQILQLLRDLNRAGTAILLITHDFGVVAELCDRVYVMYAGKIVEEGDVYAIMEQPQHPYTQGLLSAAMSLDGRDRALRTIEGVVPDLRDPPPGCRFAPRCIVARHICATDPPYRVAGPAGNVSLCWQGTDGYRDSPGAVSPEVLPG